MASLPGTIIDLTDDPVGWEMWRREGFTVVAVSAVTPDYMPEGITVLAGDPRDPVTARRIADQTSGRSVASVVANEGDDVPPEIRSLADGAMVRRTVRDDRATYEIVRDEHGEE